jgi:release factor glutamine methyltransferase
MTTVAAVLAEARALGLARLDAQRLVAHAVDRPRSWILAHGDDALDPAAGDWLTTAFERRAGGEPLAYLVGEKEFHGLVLQVDRRVLVPRPDTEALVDWAIERLQPLMGAAARPRVVDLGTGSGAIALAVKQACPAIEMVALERSADALEVARANAKRLSLDVALHESDWWSAVAGQRFELALSNPPYVEDGDPHLPALKHEPIAALAAGPDGLDDLRRIVAAAPRHLAAQGWLLFEHGHDQGLAARRLLAQAGFVEIATRLDIEGRERCSGGRLERGPAQG